MLMNYISSDRQPDAVSRHVQRVSDVGRLHRRAELSS